MITMPDTMRRPAEIERDELRRQLQGIEEREAACCPEDVPFDEYIKALNRQLAEALAEIEPKDALIEQMREALEAARLFIENGIEMGYISEPQPGTPESATLPAIKAAIKAAKGEI